MNLCQSFSHFFFSVTTTHAGYRNNKKGHYSADAELEDPGGTSIRVPKKKGTEVVKF